MNTNSNAARPLAAVPAAPRQNRMTLASVTRGIVSDRLYRMTVYGTDGVGKSTFAANAPGAIFLGPEDGTGHLDVARFPAPETFHDVIDAVTTLTVEQHDHRTLAIDSLDWLEPLIFRHVCEADKAASIEDVGGGYGKGYTAALDQWRVLLAALERMQRERRMHVVLVAHALIKPFRNPEGEDFERYVLKFNDKAAALIREWCDAVYFANYETFAKKDKAKRVRGVSTGARLMHTQRTAAYDAKDRYGVPDVLPLSWEDFDAAVKAQRPADPAALREQIAAKATELGGEIEKYSTEQVAKRGNDAGFLAQLNDRLNAKLAEKREQGGVQ